MPSLTSAVRVAVVDVVGFDIAVRRCIGVDEVTMEVAVGLVVGTNGTIGLLVGIFEGASGFLRSD